MLDLNKCYVQSLKSMSYISQSESFFFKSGRGAVGTCFASKQDFTVIINTKTRFDEFHRTQVALQNHIHKVHFIYADNQVIEYLNSSEPYVQEGLIAFSANNTLA